MLQPDYTPTSKALPPEAAARKTWMALLARAPEALLEKHLAALSAG
ncbi:MAG: hypothetical protein RLZZ454_464, partial [Pseudomonadota bacterium]